MRLLALREAARLRLCEDWLLTALDEEARSRLCGLGWRQEHERWVHSLLPTGFTISEIADGKV